MRLLSDDELIFMIRLGNEEAFRMIFSKYESFIRTWAFKSIRTQKARQVEMNDMMQIGRSEFWEVMNKYRDEEGNFFSFLKLCIEREFYAYIRSFLANIVPNYSEFSLDQTIGEDGVMTYLDLYESNYLISQPVRVYELKEEIESLYTSRLTEIEKQALSLKMLGDSYEEIGNKLQMSRKNVDNLILRIKTKIRMKR